MNDAVRDQSELATTLKAREFDQIRRVAYEYCGLDIRPGKEHLVSARLGKLMRQLGMRSFREYYDYVKHDRSGQALVSMVDALTTNHTGFFREKQHFQFLENVVLPALSKRSRIEIWSAACSTGEEPYSLVFAVLERVANSQAQELRIFATDISSRALATAQQGIYRQDRLNGLDSTIMAKYLLKGTRRAEGLCRIKPHIRDMVQFERLNLMEPFTGVGAFPLILCRNVMIYFDAQTQQDLVGRLSRQLEPGGYLFIGHSESLNGIAHSLKYVCPAVYRNSGELRSENSRSENSRNIA
ncbi:MAG TPA: protein-glutamate O-methyltransferase CheR [Acidobacteriaceae bacterium]